VHSGLHCAEGSPVADGVEIILLDFSRNPKEFHDTLSHCTALNACCEALLKAGKSPKLPSGAHLFARPEFFDAALATIAREHWDLKRRHVVVSHDLEAHVMHAVKTLPSRSQVRLKHRQAIHCSIPQSTECDHSDANPGKREPATHSEEDDFVEPTRSDEPFPFHDLVVKRTFIELPDASSIYSGPSSGQKTASTTDANPRSRFRPRRGMTT
jgi:hypothetical protein